MVRQGDPALNTGAARPVLDRHLVGSRTCKITETENQDGRMVFEGNSNLQRRDRRRTPRNMGASDFFSRHGRAATVSKFRSTSGSACKTSSHTPPRSAKLKLRAARDCSRACSATCRRSCAAAASRSVDRNMNVSRSNCCGVVTPRSLSCGAIEIGAGTLKQDLRTLL